MTTPGTILDESRVDLVDIIHNGIPEHTYVPGGHPWLLAGKRYLIPAPAGTGKSLAALVIAVTSIEHGGTVTILDVENGADEYARRLADILTARDHDGTLTDACRQRLRYHAWPQLSLTWTTDEWATALAGTDLVVFDSSRLALSGVGLAEDKADDYSRFVTQLIMPLAKAGTCTLLLDNTGHADNDRGRGTSAKGDLNEVVYILKAGAPFNRDRAGHLRLIQKRCRFAGLPQELRIPLGGNTYTAPTVAAENKDGHAGFRPTTLMERISLAVERNPGLSKRGIREDVKGQNEAKDLALEILIAEDYIQVQRDGQATRHHPLKPYRAPVPEPCPDRAPGTRAHVPVPLTKGTGHTQRTEDELQTLIDHETTR
jgi:AAA domain